MKAVKAYWTFPKAAQLLDEDYSCCKRIKSKRLIPMMPKYIGKWRKGIKEILDLDIGKYTEWIEGVFLGYNNIQLSQTSLPLDDQPSMHFAVHMDTIVFQPAVGSTLKCTVNEVAPDHVGCLAHNYFNVAIPLPKKTNAQNGERLEGLQQGTQLLVEIQKIQSMHGIISIQGKLSSILKNTFPQDSVNADTLDTDEEVPMDTSMSDDLDSSASVSIVPSQEQRHPPVPVELGSSSDLESSTSSSSPRKKKKKKKKKQKHSKEKADAALLMKVEPSVDASIDNSLDVKPPDGIFHLKSSKKHKDKKKKKLSVSDDTLEQHAIPKMPKKEKYSDLSLDSSTSDLKSDSSKSSKKKKHKIASSTPERRKNRDGGSNILVKPEPELEIDAHNEKLEDGSLQKSGKKRKHFQKEKGHNEGKSPRIKEEGDAVDGFSVRGEERTSHDKTHKKKKHKKHIKKEHDRYMLPSQEVSQDSGSSDGGKTNNNYLPLAVKRKHSKTHSATGGNLGGSKKKVKKEKV